MDGPDLSHLLDATAETPSPDVLVGIVRRHRRLRARRARTAATVGLVLVVAGAGAGIGLSRHGGGTVTALSRTSHPKMSPNGLATPAPSPGKIGSAPGGLGWVSSGAGAGATMNRPLSVASVAVPATAGTLQETSAFATATGASLCNIWSCPLYSPYGSVAGARLQRQFTRTSDGVTVRAFTASWPVAPLELVPTASATPAAPIRTVPTVAAQAQPVSCAITRALVVEVSDAGAVGVVTVPLGPSLARPIDVVADRVVGSAELSPVAVVVAHATRRTSAVRVEFRGAARTR